MLYATDRPSTSFCLPYSAISSLAYLPLKYDAVIAAVIAAVAGRFRVTSVYVLAINFSRIGR